MTSKNLTNESESHLVTDMQVVIERLRISKRLSDAKFKDTGRIDGRGWAKYKAEAIELQRLEEAFETEMDWAYCEPGASYSAAEKFFFIIAPEFAGNRAAAAAFWEVVAVECDTNDYYALHFAYGAMDMWRDVKWSVLH